MKKSYRSLDIRLAEQFQIIKRLEGSFPAKTLCDTFEVYRSSYRYWRNGSGRLSSKELRTRHLIKTAHRLCNGSAKARSIAKIVTTIGEDLFRYRANRRVKLLGLVSSQLPKHRYRKAEQAHIAIPNVLDRCFNVKRLNQVWVRDIIYVWAGKRWAYLAVAMALYGRKPVG